MIIIFVVASIIILFINHHDHNHYINLLQLHSNDAT